MRSERAKVSGFFQVNENLFYLTNLFIFIGLIQSNVHDIPNMFIPLGLANLIAMGIQIILFVLVFAGRLSRNSAMAVLLIISIFIFQISAFAHSNRGGNVDLQIAITTFISLLFASLSAFTVSKYMALGIGLVNLVFFISISLYYNSARMISDMVFFSTVIIGYTIAMYHYRYSLESLAEGLYDAYRVVKKQKVELELLKDKAERINEVNRPFVVFGKNTSGLIHDFKNDIAILGATGQLFRMKLKQDKTIDSEDIDAFESQLARLSDRVENIKYVVSASSFREAEDIPLNKLVHATIYPFRLTEDLKSRIVFDFSVEGDLHIKASRYRLVQVLENLIRNACEAIVDEQDRMRLENMKDPGPGEEQLSVEQLLATQQSLGRVRVEVRRLDRGILIAVDDNGPGMDFCNDCEESNCLDCAQFEIGRTTKSYGSGLGMVNVIEAVNSLKGRLRIRSRYGRGTRVEVLIPESSDSALPRELQESLGF